MTVIANTKPYLSSVLMSDATALVADFNYAQVNLKEAANTTVSLGQLVYWNGTDAYRVLKNADFTSDTVLATAAGIPSLPDGSQIGVVVGFNGSIGGEFDATVGTSAVKAFVLFRGIAAVKESGLLFDVSVAAAARKDLIKRQLEAKFIEVKAVAPATGSSFYGY